MSSSIVFTDLPNVGIQTPLFRRKGKCSSYQSMHFRYIVTPIHTSGTLVYWTLVRGWKGELTHWHLFKELEKQRHYTTVIILIITTDEVSQLHP